MEERGLVVGEYVQRRRGGGGRPMVDVRALSLLSWSVV